MSFPKYSKYKNSRSDVLESIPGHWNEMPLKYLATLKGRLGWQGLRAEEYTEDGPYLVTSAHFSNDRIDWNQCFHVPQDRYEMAPEIQLQPGDLLMMKDGAAMGKLAYVDDLPGPACLNSHLLLFRPIRGQVHNRFLYYILGSPYFESYMVKTRTGTTFFGISQTSISTFMQVHPPLHEQTAIATFLDAETSKIDSLIAEQQRLIALLKEKRQAVISHAVTKGLNPNAPIKPSGIEWIGDVPEHWEVFPLKRDLLFITSGSRGWAENYADEGEVFLRIGNLTRDSINLDLSDIQRVVVPEGTEGARTRVSDGDLLFSVTAYLGSIAVVPEGFESAYVSQHVALARLSGRRLLSKWVGYSALSNLGQTWFDRQGYGGTKVQLSLDDVREIPIPVPPLAEQQTIVVFIESEATKFDTLIAEAKSAINLLQERRTALISAAVTGKIDVREPTGKETA